LRGPLSVDFRQRVHDHPDPAQLGRQQSLAQAAIDQEFRLPAVASPTG
jgi:hypothetical protein